jgi:hypothetical protein
VLFWQLEKMKRKETAHLKSNISAMKYKNIEFQINKASMVFPLRHNNTMAIRNAKTESNTRGNKAICTICTSSTPA